MMAGHIPKSSHGALLTLMVLCFGTALPQMRTADDLRKKFDQYATQTLQEKVYVHTDRASYLTGETMWFSIYLTDGKLHQPLGLSKVVYLEILDTEHKAVLQTKISMTEGRGTGTLYLPPSLQSGNYLLRAYTNWMKNFPADFYFSTQVTVINAFRKLEAQPSTVSHDTDLRFFPEGGQLVEGIENRMAFRATDNAGRGISFTGAVLNERNDTIVSFHPVKAGIGSFRYTPAAELYRAVIRDASGKVSHHHLPEAAPSGYVLNATETGQQQVSVTVRTKSADPQQVHLFVHARNHTLFSGSTILSNGNAEFVLGKDQLAEGITHITLFDAQFRPVCERLWFRQPENPLTIYVYREETGSYLNRRRVTLELTTAFGNTTGPAGLSVSVYKLDSLPEHEGNIVTSFWLTSDLKGTVEDPEYYFSSNSTEVRTAADHLMLTHGWRRFKWVDVLNQSVSTPHLPEYRGHIIRGVVQHEDGRPAQSVLTFLSAPSKTVRLNTALSNGTGEVMFEMQKFFGKARVIAQTNFLRDSTSRVKILSPFSADPPSVQPEALTLNVGHASSILARSVAMQVQDIYFEDEADTPQPAADSTTFYGKPDHSYDLDAFTRFPVMEEVMREYVPGVWVRKRRDGFHFMVVDNINRTVFDRDPLMLIDGVPFFDADEIMQFDPLKVKRLDVFTRQYFLGPASFAGIVSYRTYHGDLAGFPVNRNAMIMDYDGLQQHREFYTPRYDTGAQRRSRLPDQRTLLYWNPSVSTDENGKAALEFFTSDVSGTFRVVVEGITGDGKVGTGSLEFRVSGEM